MEKCEVVETPATGLGESPVIQDTASWVLDISSVEMESGAETLLSVSSLTGASSRILRISPMGGGHRTGRPSTEEECGVIIVIEDGDCKVQNWFGVMMDPGHMLEVIQSVSVSFK